MLARSSMLQIIILVLTSVYPHKQSQDGRHYFAQDSNLNDSMHLLFAPLAYTITHITHVILITLSVCLVFSTLFPFQPEIPAYVL